jgi:DNA-binding response OmpR family regulator
MYAVVSRALFMKILLVEDDYALVEVLLLSLAANHYTVDLAANGEVGLEFASLWKYDLVILDVNLPKLDGLSLCRKLRSQGFITPILMLTGQSSNQEISTGLDAGADDYVAKPCNLEQLLARIRALLRRGNIATISPILTWGNLSLDPAIAQVTYQSQIIPVRPKEYTLLELFLRCPQQIFSRDAVIDRLWIADDCPTKHAVTNLIKDLRQRLNAAGMTEELIETVYGIGYRLKVSPQILNDQSQTLEPKNTAKEEKRPDQTSSDVHNSAGFAKIRSRFNESLAGRIKILQMAGRSLQTGTLTDDQRKSAKDEAHRLAGSLGTFGYPQGSVLAKAIECLLIGSNALTTSEIVNINQLILDLGQAINSSDQCDKEVVSELPKPVVLFMGDDLKLADALYLEAIAQGMRLEMVKLANIDQCKEQISIILLALEQSEDLAQLSTLKQYFPIIPVLVIADRLHQNPQEILHERVEVARRGGDRYLLQPISPKEIFAVVNQLITEQRSRTDQVSDGKKSKIMIVDDDPLILEFMANLLQPWGLEVTCLENPLEFWQVLTATQPDLLILDWEMPTFKGIELCQVIRSDPEWMELPILMITAHQDADIISQAFAAGCDDFVRKPIIEPELIVRIFKHLQPTRLQT